MNTKYKRLDYLDRAKGIAIILLLLTHSMYEANMVQTWISAFRMPIFFIICGYLMQYRHPEGLSTVTEWKNYFEKRFYNMFVPYLLFGALLVCFYWGLDLISGNSIDTRRLINLITLYGVDSMWFLPVYFFSEMLFYYCRNKCSLVNLGVLSCGILVLFVFVGQTEIPDKPIQFDLVLEGFVFVFIGYICAFFKVVDRIKSIHMGGGIVLIFSVLVFMNQGANMANMNNILLFVLNAIGINVGLFVMCKQPFRISKVEKFIMFFGKNSLIVLCTNNLLIEIVRLIDYKIFDNILCNGYWGIIVFWIILIILEVPMILLFKDKFKKKSIKSVWENSRFSKSGT